MTLRTSSATRRRVVSRSSVVLTTSATSSSRGSIRDSVSSWTAAISTTLIISVRAGEAVVGRGNRGRSLVAGRRSLVVGRWPLAVGRIQRQSNTFLADYRRPTTNDQKLPIQPSHSAKRKCREDSDSVRRNQA